MVRIARQRVREDGGSPAGLFCRRNLIGPFQCAVSCRATHVEFRISTSSARFGNMMTMDSLE
jgi:hypothetical protein